MQIILKDIVLFGYHGVHPLEKKVGTPFRINIQINLDSSVSVQSLSDTLDYAQVFDILKKEFHPIIYSKVIFNPLFLKPSSIPRISS